MSDDQGIQYWQEVGQWEQERRIVVQLVYPPIPTKAYDYMAAYEGYDESSVVGWGASPMEAIEDLKEKEQ